MPRLRLRRELVVLSAATAALLVTGCRPTAQIHHSTPVANLRPYHTVVIRVNVPEARPRLAELLKQRTELRLRRNCQFSSIDFVDAGNKATGDLVVDLSVKRSVRGGGGAIIQPQGQHMMDVAMVLSDGGSDELLGSALIRGESARLNTTGLPPATQAADAVAYQVAHLMKTSGCHLPRTERIAAAPPPTTGGGEAGADDSGSSNTDGDSTSDDGGTVPPNVALNAGEGAPPPEAETANKHGKDLFRQGDVAAAKTEFEKAIAIHKDPRYQFNLCLAQEALNEYTAAANSCSEVLALKPSPRLREKAELRLEILKQRAGG